MFSPFKTHSKHQKLRKDDTILTNQLGWGVDMISSFWNLLGSSGQTLEGAPTAYPYCLDPSSIVCSVGRNYHGHDPVGSPQLATTFTLFSTQFKRRGGGGWPNLLIFHKPQYVQHLSKKEIIYIYWLFSITHIHSFQQPIWLAYVSRAGGSEDTIWVNVSKFFISNI